MTEKCKHCGNIHEFRCPLVKSIEYYEDGTLKKIEYMTPADYGTMSTVISVPVYGYPFHRPPVILSYPITTFGNRCDSNFVSDTH
jgi:hypothetical protein